MKQTLWYNHPWSLLTIIYSHFASLLHCCKRAVEVEKLKMVFSMLIRHVQEVVSIRLKCTTLVDSIMLKENSHQNWTGNTSEQCNQNQNLICCQLLTQTRSLSAIQYNNTKKENIKYLQRRGKCEIWVWTSCAKHSTQCNESNVQCFYSVRE